MSKCKIGQVIVGNMQNSLAKTSFETRYVEEKSFLVSSYHCVICHVIGVICKCNDNNQNPIHQDIEVLNFGIPMGNAKPREYIVI